MDSVITVGGVIVADCVSSRSHNVTDDEGTVTVAEHLPLRAL